MESSDMKNMVVIKNLPSNMVEEAIIIFKENQRVKERELIERGCNINSSETQTKSRDYILKEAEMLVTDYIKKFNIKTSTMDQIIKNLSGGNQQKAIIAREVDRNPDLLIVSQPTRGLDVGAIEYIHKRLIGERDKGKAVLVVSFELDEILNLSDRIAVIHDGKIQGIVKPSETNKQELGILMAGGEIKEASNE